MELTPYAQVTDGLVVVPIPSVNGHDHREPNSDLLYLIFPGQPNDPPRSSVHADDAVQRSTRSRGDGNSSGEKKRGTSSFLTIHCFSLPPTSSLTMTIQTITPANSRAIPILERLAHLRCTLLPAAMLSDPRSGASDQAAALLDDMKKRKQSSDPRTRGRRRSNREQW